MKKLLFLVTVLCTVFSASAYAETGDVIGHIYSTDIRAFVNDVEVPSYNIGGRTVVIIEDIINQINYSDDLRVLTFSTLHPKYLQGGEAESYEVSGDIVGDIYETDIKTYMFDTVVPAYNLDGKTAVALEDMGGFGEYNDLGGRYFYDDTERVIRLETIYDNSYDALLPVNINATLSKDKVNAEFYGDAYLVGGNVFFDDEMNQEMNKEENMFLPIMAKVNNKEEQIGWFFQHKIKRINMVGILKDGQLLTSGYVVSDEDDYKNVFELEDSSGYQILLFEDVIADAKKNVKIPELSVREQVLRDKIVYNLYEVKNKFETEDYIFAYCYSPTMHGANSQLLLIQNDGTYHDYRDDFGYNSDAPYGTLLFSNVKIDKENEKCTFTAKKEKYEIDLKTGKMTKIG